MKKPFYMFNGEKCRVHSISYHKHGELCDISIHDSEKSIKLIWNGKDIADTGHYHDEQLEQNIIWEESQ